MRKLVSLAGILALTACYDEQPVAQRHATKPTFISVGGQSAGMVVPPDMPARNVLAAAQGYCKAKRPCEVFGTRDFGKAAGSQTHPDRAKADFYYAIDATGAETIEADCAVFQDTKPEHCVQH